MLDCHLYASGNSLVDQTIYTIKSINLLLKPHGAPDIILIFFRPKSADLNNQEFS